MKKQDAIDHFGSGQKVAQALGISGAAVSKWGDIVPEKQAYRLERMTDGKLKADEDDYK